MSVEPVRHLFTVAEYEQMADAGILSPDDRVELLGGEIYEKVVIHPPHASTVDRIAQLFILALEGRGVVRVQGPIVLSDLSEPEPDVTILKARPDFYSERHPRPDDVLLVIEVSDSTVRFDRNVKRRLYSTADVVETWIVDIPAGVLEVATEPEVGDYGRVQRLEPGESVTPVALADLDVAVADILG